MLRALQITGGMTCLVATMIAWSAAATAFGRERTPFISEVLALPWRHPRARGAAVARLAAALFVVGALAFVAAAAVRLARGWSASAVAAFAVGALLVCIVFVPLREVEAERIPEAGGLDLLHPFFAASFYLVSIVAAFVVAVPRAGRFGMVLTVAHVATSVQLTAAVFDLSWRELGRDGFRPWYLPGVRILLDRRPLSQSPTEWIRRLQWPATLLIALDLGLTPLGI